MTLDYLQLDFHLTFQKEICFKTYPLFLVRSVLGNELHEMFCASTCDDCEKCLFLENCNYAAFFETILSKENSVVPGRVRGCHPFVMNLKSRTQKSITFTITLLGQYVSFAGYVYKALVNAQGKGLENNKYIVDSVQLNGEDILQNGRLQVDGSSLKKFELVQNCTEKIDVDYKIYLESPLKLMKENEQLKQFDSFTFLNAANRRIRQVIDFYGSADDKHAYALGKKNLICNENFDFQYLSRWSSRQKRVEPLGGITGSFELKGTISKFEKSLLEAAVIFGVGKNTNFGLGKINVYRQEMI